MKSTLVLVLMLLSTAVYSLETSLVMRAPGATGSSGVYAVVQPATGNITLYALEGNQTTRYGSANFLEDLELLESVPYAIRDGQFYSLLRVGDAGCLPTASELLTSPAFPDKTSEREQKAGLKSLRTRAIQAEDKFWNDKKPYDGVVRGSLGAQYLLLCIPCKHALILYDCSDRNKGPIRTSWRNYGVDLMIPQTYNSSPAPQDILSQLPPDVQEEKKKEIQEQMEKMKEDGGFIQLQPSDPWIASGTGDRWVLVDPPNKHIVTYEYTGRNWAMRSARNLEIDQLIPTSYNSIPDERRGYEQYLQSRKKQLEALGIIPDLAYFKALVNQKRVESAKTSDIQANIVGDDLVLDFVKLRKIYAYRLLGQNNGLEFVSMRDYTLDVGLGLQDVELRAEARAMELWTNIAKRTIGKNPELGWAQVQAVLNLNPDLYKVIEKDSNAKKLKKLPDYQQVMDKAMAASAEKQKKLEDRRKAAEEERKKKAGK